MSGDVRIDMTHARPLFRRGHDRAWQVIFGVGFPLARIWWRLSGTPHEGSLVAIRVDRDLLLVRSSYRGEWNLPGGGVKRGEAPVDAAMRELREELGLHVQTLGPGRVFAGCWDGRPDRVHVHELWLDALPPLQVDNREILEARLVSPERLAELPLTGPVAAYLSDIAQPGPR